MQHPCPRRKLLCRLSQNTLTNKLTHKGYKLHKEKDHHVGESERPQEGKLASRENRTEQRPRCRGLWPGRSMDNKHPVSCLGGHRIGLVPPLLSFSTPDSPRRGSVPSLRYWRAETPWGALSSMHQGICLSGGRDSGLTWLKLGSYSTWPLLLTCRIGAAMAVLRSKPSHNFFIIA